jgi:hypothetical protein
VIDDRAVRAFAHGDVGDWSQDAIEHLVSGLGWRIDDDASIQGFSIGFSTGWLGLAAMNLSDEYDEQFGFGECVSVFMSPIVSGGQFGGEYRTAMATVTAVLGPPAMVSGPGTGALWRLPDRYVELHGSLRAGTGKLSLSVMPRDPLEEREFHEASRNGDFDPQHLWAAFPDTDGPVFETVADMVVHGRRLAADWDQLATGVRAVFGSLAVDVPLLAPYLRRVMWRIAPRDSPAGRYAQGWFTDHECHLEAPGADLPTTAKNGITGLTLDSGAEATGERIAEVTMTAIRAWGLAGPGDLTCRAWTTRLGSRLVVFGVGL